MTLEEQRVAAIFGSNASAQQRLSSFYTHVAGVRARGDVDIAVSLERTFASNVAELERTSAASVAGQPVRENVGALMRRQVAALQQARAAAHAPSPTSPEEIAREDAALHRWDELAAKNPFAASQYLLTHQRDIVAAKQRRGR